ncbi:MAG TPA: glycosyltransferase family 39 protein [Candidatus Limnocylindria bacterium]|nr:glycosyltransferase family 39 protein [Candidatus Limnocylindria bacterium]
MTPERELFREPTPRDNVRAALQRASGLMSRPWVVWTLFIVTVAGVIWFHLPSMNQPLLEHHSFRQTQTAWTSLIFHEQGIDLFHPRIPVFGPPWVVPFEFPLFQAIASLVMNFTATPDLAMRVSGFATFLLAMLLVSRLVARLAGEAAALVSVLAFAVCGLALLWARTSTIEYFVVDASLAMLYGALRWHESRHWAWWALALGAGVVAMLVKPTTAVMYLPALMALGWTGFRMGRDRPMGRPLLYGAALLALIAVPLLFGGLWTVYADRIKAASEFTANQTSAALTTWNFGTIPQRLNPDTWGLILGRVNELVLGGQTYFVPFAIGFLWVPLGFIASLWLKRRLFTIAWLAGAFVGPLVFVNLYYIHDYYLIALTPMAAAAVGIGLVWTARKWKWVVPPLLGAFLVVCWIGNLKTSEHYWVIQFYDTHGGEHHLEAAEYIDARSAPDDLIVMVGRGWNPGTFYYARRWGLMLEGDEQIQLQRALGPLLPQLQATGYKWLFDCPPGKDCVATYDLTTTPPRLIP